MYNQPFYMPGYYPGTMSNLTRGAMMPGRALGAAGASRGASLFGRLGNAFGAIKAFNWSGLINNTSKTLGIINQTIPLVRQVGPMVGNMRSMLRLASAFKDETDTTNTSNSNHSKINNNNSTTNNNHIQVQEKNDIEKKETLRDNITSDSPTFFIN